MKWHGNDMQTCQWNFSTEIWGKTVPKDGEMTPNARNGPEMRIQAPETAYSYAKYARYEHEV